MKSNSLQELIQRVGRSTGIACREVLYQLRVAEPSHFVFHLMASAVACRASRVQARNDELDFVFEWNGLPPSPEALIDLYASFQQTSCDERTRYLSLGLNSAFATGIAQLQLESWDGRQGLRLIMTPAGQEHQRLQLDPFAGQGWCLRIRFLERCNFRSLARAVNHLTQKGLPECDALEQRCNWAGPNLLLDRIPLNQRVEPGRAMAWSWLFPQESMPHLEFNFIPPRQGLQLSQAPQVPFYALLAFDAHLLPWKGLRAIVNGVTTLGNIDLAFRDLSVLLAAPNLECDVNFHHLIRTPALAKVTEILDSIAARLAEELRSRPDMIGFDQAEQASRIFEDLSKYYTSQERPDLAINALRSALEYREQVLGAVHPDLVDGWTRLLEWNRSLGDPQAVLPIQERLIPLLRASGENHIRKHRVAEGTALLKRALELEEQLPQPPEGLSVRYHELAVLVKEHRLSGSEELFQKALTLQKSEPDQDPHLTLKSVFELADRHRANRKHAEAEVQARKALELAEELHGSETRELVPYLKLLAEILKASNRYAEATDYESRATLLRFKR